MLDDIIIKLMDLSNQIKGKKVVIFGCGKGSKLTRVALRNFGIEPSYFVDNDINKAGQEIDNISIMPAEHLVSEHKDQLAILIATTTYYHEIIDQLSKLGFRENIHMFSVLPLKSVVANNSTRFERVVNGVKVGKYSYGYERLCYTDVRLESVGAFCSINNTVQIGTNHPTEFITTHPFFYIGNNQFIGAENVPQLLDDDDVVNVWDISKNGKVIIGHDVWIGANVVLLPSIKIGNGAIIGAGAVVTKDVPDYAVVTGVPARVIKYRFNQEEIDLLNHIRWWDWPDDKIKENVHYFMKNQLFFEVFGEFTPN